MFAPVLKCLFFFSFLPPHQNLKVEGDTVTFSFEMRSGREHNTPDKAMWGFACTVRAQVLKHDIPWERLSLVCLLSVTHSRSNRNVLQSWKLMFKTYLFLITYFGSKTNHLFTVLKDLSSRLWHGLGFYEDNNY